MSEQDELSDSKIKQMWIDAWLEQDTGVEPDEEEMKALKSFLAKAKQHYEQTACDKCDIRAVKSCPVINKLVELYPEIKLDLYLKTITGGK